MITIFTLVCILGRILYALLSQCAKIHPQNDFSSVYIDNRNALLLFTLIVALGDAMG
jgi:hypothetical protein